MRQSNPLSALLSRSPFKPMQAHMDRVTQCVTLVPGLIDALIATDQGELDRTREAIFARESEADDLKNQVRLHLPRSLFLPVDRRDLLEILEVQDSIADTAQDIAGLLMQRALPVPEDMREPLKTLTRRCVDACIAADQIIGELDELVETGFRGPEATRVETMIESLNKTETETDRLGMALTQQLLAHEGDLSPVSLMLWYELIRAIGKLADTAERVGDRLLLLIAR